MMSISKYLLVLFLSFGIGIKVHAQKIASMFECSSSLEQPYGFCAHITRLAATVDYAIRDAQLNLMKGLGVSWVRSDIDYGIMNSTNSGVLDSVLNSTGKYNINLLGIAYDSRFYTKEWGLPTAYRKYFSLLSSYYAKQFRRIEFVNEVNASKVPNVFHHYVSELEDFSKIKSNNPNLKILFSGIYGPSEAFIDSTMNLKAYRYFDIMNIHDYSDPEHIPNFLLKVRNNMKSYGWSKPVWLTEVGYSTQKDSLDQEPSEFFTKVVPVALKKLGYTMKGLHYGVLSDSSRYNTVLTSDEITLYIKKQGAEPRIINVEALGSINAKDVPVLVATKSENFDVKYFPALLSYVKKGGTIILSSGAPFYYDINNKILGDRYASQLHIGELFWWDTAAKKMNAPEVPTWHEANRNFGVTYTYDFDKKSGRTARYLTDSRLQAKDKMTPISFAGNKDYKGVVAALYKLNSDLKGNVIVQTRLREPAYFSREYEQARRIARIHIISFAYGVDKVFWYKFRSCENNLYYKEDNFGIVHKNLSPKPAYYAYKAMTSMMPSGSSRPVLEIIGDIYKAHWIRPDGKIVWAFWNPKGSCGNHQLVYTGSPMFYDYTGNYLKNFNNGKFEISPAVMYVVGATSLSIK